MEIPTLSYETARGVPGARFVDMRSPAEFAADHVPGARNVPLFDDAQRAVVGTLYKQESPEAAYDRGLGIVEARLPELLSDILGRDVPQEAWIDRFRELAERARGMESSTELLPLGAAPDGAVVVSCWRGGMRSRSMVALLRALGEDRVVHLSDGYKGYRQWVQERLAAFDPATPLVVLRGPTGVGKTRILHDLESAAPGSTVDLEGFAQHRSSILGDVGMEPTSQKAFESAFAARLDALGEPPWFVEGESRKVGDRIVPAPFFAAMERGIQVRLDAPREHRIRLLGDDYLGSEMHRLELRERLPFLEERLGALADGELGRWLDGGRWEEVADVLLEKYYDPRYARSDARRTWARHFDAASPEIVAELLAFRGERDG